MVRRVAALAFVFGLAGCPQRSEAPAPPVDPVVIDPAACEAALETIARIDVPSVAIGDLNLPTLDLEALAVGADETVFYVLSDLSGKMNDQGIWALAPAGGPPRRILALDPDVLRGTISLWVDGDAILLMSVGRLFTTSTSGAPLRQVAQVADPPLFGSMAIDKAYVYALAAARDGANYHGEAWRIPRAGGEGERIFSTDDEAAAFLYHSELAIDDTALYFVAANDRIRVPKAGGPGTTLQRGTSGPVAKLAFWAGTVISQSDYASEFGGAWIRVFVDGSQPPRRVAGLDDHRVYASDVVADANGAYVDMDLRMDAWVGWRTALARVGAGDERPTATACSAPNPASPHLRYLTLGPKYLYAVTLSDFFHAPHDITILRAAR